MGSVYLYSFDGTTRESLLFIPQTEVAERTEYVGETSGA
jgi:hypothetical protein